MTAVSDETGRDWLPLKYEDGPDFCTVTFATGAAFALTVHPERMKLMEAALSAAPVKIETGPVTEGEYAASIAPVSDAVATVTYTNWRGETSIRRIIPKSVRYGSTEWHPEPQWLLLAWDDDKKADREFALKDFGATSAGLGADEIARLAETLGIMKEARKKLQPMSVWDDDIRAIERALALLSRAGDQSNSTHEA